LTTCDFSQFDLSGLSKIINEGIVDVIGTIEGLSTLEGKGHLRSSAEMELPNRR
jgi:hypothetical protein